MINPPQIYHLAQPLLARAYPLNNTYGLPDYAAQHILARLGVSSALCTNKAFNQKNTLGSDWVDTQVEKFLAVHPYAKGVEIECGISTRFHRLSRLSDWPRFSWQIISNTDVDKFLTYTLPKLDNFEHMASLTLLSHWAKNLNIQEQKALFIIAGEQRTLNKNETNTLITYLLSPSFSHIKSIELALFHHLDNKPLSDIHTNRSIEVLHQWQPHYSWWQRLIRKYPYFLDIKKHALSLIFNSLIPKRVKNEFALFLHQPLRRNSHQRTRSIALLDRTYSKRYKSLCGMPN